MSHWIKYVIGIVLILGLCVIVGCIAYTNKWEKQSFARECNDVGGVARDIDGMIQCVGGKP